MRFIARLWKSKSQVPCAKVLDFQTVHELVCSYPWAQEFYSSEDCADDGTKGDNKPWRCLPHEQQQKSHTGEREIACALPSFLLVIGALPFWDQLRKQPRAQSALAVKMYFPRFTGAETDEVESRSEPVAEAEQSETILIVEDDKDLRNYIAELLRNLNYRVLTTPNAQGALTILLQDDRQVDLLLTDIVMPGTNGRELGKRARAMRPGLPVLYMTGYSRNAIVHQGQLEKGVELLQKPIGQAPAGCASSCAA